MCARLRVRIDVLTKELPLTLSGWYPGKSGSAFDLSIAASVALATGLVSPAALDAVLIKENLPSMEAFSRFEVLPAVLAAFLGVRRVSVPTACAQGHGWSVASGT